MKIVIILWPSYCLPLNLYLKFLRDSNSYIHLSGVQNSPEYHLGTKPKPTHSSHKYLPCSHASFNCTIILCFFLSNSQITLPVSQTHYQICLEACWALLSRAARRRPHYYSPKLSQSCRQSLYFCLWSLIRDMISTWLKPISDSWYPTCVIMHLTPFGCHLLFQNLWTLFFKKYNLVIHNWNFVYSKCHSVSHLLVLLIVFSPNSRASCPTSSFTSILKLSLSSIQKPSQTPKEYYLHIITL